MSNVIIDTHVIIWYLSNTSKLSQSAETAIDKAVASGFVFVLSISIVELIYLTEKGRIPPDILELLYDILDDNSSGFAAISLTDDIARDMANVPKNEVPEMPDRVIAATGLALDIPIVAKDSSILGCSTIETIW